MTTTFEAAQVGDRVWSIERGWGVIQSLGGGETYPIIVEFQNERSLSYTLGGKRLITHDRQTIFWDEIEIEAPQKPLPNLEVDAKVLVWNDPSDKHNRHFSHFGVGCIWTFKYGCTSFTSEHISATTAWSYWELAE